MDCKFQKMQRNTSSRYQRLIMDKKLKKLFDDYEGNLLNYFCGMTPKQSKKFNQMKKKSKETKNA